MVVAIIFDRDAAVDVDDWDCGFRLEAEEDVVVADKEA